MERQRYFLIGFMGSGKSHWGRIWAKQLGMNFIDLDEEIEKSTGKSIDEIFEKQGEPAFRALEEQHLRRMALHDGVIVACGGGAPVHAANMDWMLENGLVIYLKANPRYLLDRVMDETDKRPLLKKVNPAELLYFIQKKLKEREPVYERAHHIIDVKKVTEHTIANLLAKNEKAEQRRGKLKNIL